jgi:hypothetical protein
MKKNSIKKGIAADTIPFQQKIAMHLFPAIVFLFFLTYNLKN